MDGICTLLDDMRKLYHGSLTGSNHARRFPGNSRILLKFESPFLILRNIKIRQVGPPQDMLPGILPACGADFHRPGAFTMRNGCIMVPWQAKGTISV